LDPDGAGGRSAEGVIQDTSPIDQVTRFMPDSRKVAIITGASRGIGAGLVAGFRGAGYAVVGTSRSISARDEPDYFGIQGDISERESAEQIVQQALARFGRIDSLINDAGVFISKPFSDYTDQDLAAMTAVNLAGFFHVTQAAIRNMAAQRSGHVVNITTSVAERGFSGRPSALLALTEGGLASVTRSLAVEYASRGVRVNAVAPGVIKTPENDPASYKGLAALHPLGRLGEVDDIVDAILYLERATFVTGEILHVDGGQSAGR
jgi:NAD(P)-dependent dehydrogenase (short-subunit alcohol dehydrogenase family)